MYAVVSGLTLSGQPDIYYLKDRSKKTLNDFKTPSKMALEKGVKIEYEKQLNVYKYLAVENGYPVDDLELTAFIRDSRSYEERIKTFQVKQYKHEMIKKYLEKRMATYKLYKSGLLCSVPECSPAERWQTETTYSIKKKGNTKQTGKSCDTLQQAERILQYHQEKHPKNEYSIEVNHGTNKRCESWCVASRFCWAYQSFLETKVFPDSTKEIEGVVINDLPKSVDQTLKELKGG
jgi:hypothetical protein